MAEHVIEKLKQFLQTNPSEQQLKAWMALLPPSEHAECALYMFRNSPTTFAQVINSEHAYKNPDKLTDEQLFRELAKAVDDACEIKNERIALVSLRENPEPMSRFASLINEAVRRGLTREEIYAGMRPFSEESKKFDSVFPKDPQWKRFERVVAQIHAAFFPGADVQWSQKLSDRTGRTRQIDVSIRHKVGPYSFLVIVECKHEKQPVSIDEVEALITKKEDLKANLAILVSSSGFQEGAKAKASFHDARLWTLEEAEKVSWREEIRTVQLYYHMFDSIDFHPRLPHEAASEGSRLYLDEVMIQTPTKRFSLARVAASAIHQATERCLRIPCVLDLNLEAGSQMECKAGGFPIERVSFDFTKRVVVEMEQLVRVPTGIVYKYSSAEGTPTFTLREGDLPKLD